MKLKLPDKSIQYVVRELKKGRDIGIVAKEVRVAQQRTQRLWAEYLKIGTVGIHTEYSAYFGPFLLRLDS